LKDCETPSSGEELAHLLQEAASQSRIITVQGNNSKRLMAGPVAAAEVTLSTAKLTRVLEYEPNDLTLSVEAGMRFAQVQKLLGARGQMIALDPPHSAEATIGGVVAANSSGPMRRAFGTARDLVIGMSFAMLDGKVVKTGGMVVKNVAGLDMGKLMIGSFGTLAVITSVNFRVHAAPRETRTFLFTTRDLESVMERRDSILRGVLQPLALDVMSPAASARLGRRGYLLALRAGGSKTVLQRYARELNGAEQLAGDADNAIWQQIREFSPEFLGRQPGGIIARVSTTLSDTVHVLRLATGPCIARAASGVSYLYFTSWQGVAPIWRAAQDRGWSAVIEYAPDEIRSTKDLWVSPVCGDDSATFAMMKKVKELFDPKALLNRSRLYGRI
jgi:glycolate oxidase FAD binding subunit